MGNEPITFEYDLVLGALSELMLENEYWFSNYKLYIQYDRPMQEWWFRRAKLQAEKGVPAMRELVDRVIALKMQS